jgi:hypothetical protein
VGLAGYALWGFVRAILDPLGRGTDAKGLFDRVGFFFSGLSYAALLIPTVLTLMNKPGGAAQVASTGMLPSLMAGPMGKWVGIAFGIFWMAAGIGQLAAAFTAHFLRDLKLSTMSAEEAKTATLLGQIGYAARGIVFGLIGGIILQTANTVGARQAPGFDAALAALAHGPYGEVLLAAVAIGLVLFGAYSALCAKWVRIGRGG